MLDDLSGFHYFFGTIILENSSKITINLAKNEKKTQKMSKYIFQQIPGIRSITKYSRYLHLQHYISMHLHSNEKH